jgi:hypothetical protein
MARNKTEGLPNRSRSLGFGNPFVRYIFIKSPEVLSVNLYVMKAYQQVNGTIKTQL